jgi:ABC-type multidrug transport system fused ATPase/permease subunit
MESNEEETGRVFNSTEISEDFSSKLSIDALMYKSRKYKLLRFISIVIVLLPQLILVHYFIYLVKQASFAYYFIHAIIYLIALFIAFVISIDFILNRYAKNKARVLLRTEKETGSQALFTSWPSKAVRNYQKIKLIKYLEQKRITELPQYEFLSERIDITTKSIKSTSLIGFGALISICTALFLQLNEHIISKIPLNLIISLEVVIAMLVASVWLFINYTIQFYQHIINKEKRHNEQLNSLLKEIVFEMRMKKHAIVS